MSWVELGISPAVFLARLSDISVTHAIVGLSKAPVFALIIGVIGCHAGMRVGKDAESLGRMTSSAVVSAIFAVIIMSAVVVRIWNDTKSLDSHDLTDLKG